MNDVLRQAGTNLEWANQTTLHPLGLAALFGLGLAMLLVPRRVALVPMFLLACLIPSAQRLVVASLDFDLLRLMVLFGWMRITLRQEAQGFRWRAADILMIAWAISGTIAYTMLWGTSTAFINRLGGSFDALGMYFLFRILVRDWSDLICAVKWLCVIAMPVAVAFTIESQTARNAFAIFGGVPAITDVREGRLRCQGAFSHPILAGCFWAALLPLMIAMWWQIRFPKWLVVCGIGAALMIIVACASSTPIMAVLFAAFGGGMFMMRNAMRHVRWGFVAMLVVLHMSMKAPVWHLMGRVDIVSGSTGWHRYHLLDEAINHWTEWAMIGIRSTSQWGHGLQDITNHYLLEGVSGGLLTMALFIAIIAVAFGSVGRMWRACAAVGDRAGVYLAWAVGVSLFVHCMNFLAVSYFGQIMMMWYFALAIAVSLDPKTRGLPAAWPATQAMEAPRVMRRVPINVPASAHTMPRSPSARF
jgi:hypothetical protein